MNKEKIYFDVNVIIDLLDTTRPGNLKAQELLKKLALDNITIVISEDMISTIFYIVKNKPLVLKFLHIIQRKWYIAHFGKEIIKEAISLSLDKGLDLEDTLQCLCAKANGCHALITNDKAFYDCEIMICTVDEFLLEDNR